MEQLNSCPYVVSPSESKFTASSRAGDATKIHLRQKWYKLGKPQSSRGQRVLLSSSGTEEEPAWARVSICVGGQGTEPSRGKPGDKTGLWMFLN